MVNDVQGLPASFQDLVGPPVFRLGRSVNVRTAVTSASFTTWSVEYYTQASQSARTLIIKRVNRLWKTGQVFQKTGQVSPKSGQVSNMTSCRMVVFPHNQHPNESKLIQTTGQVIKKRVRFPFLLNAPRHNVPRFTHRNGLSTGHVSHPDLGLLRI